MFEDVIVDQNPHWDNLFFEPGIPRKAMETVRKYIDARQVISIVGVRRCGKSTLLRQTINYLIREKDVLPSNILFLNLENPYFTPYRKDIRNLEKIYDDYLKIVDPHGTIYFFLDELQYFSDWQVFIKSKYETENIKFFITGSNSQLLSSELVTLLSGRTLPLTLYPFDFNEYLLARGEQAASPIQAIRNRNRLRKLCDNYLSEGGFPEVVLAGKKLLKKDILFNYAKNILYQDIVPRFELKKPYEVEKLFYYLVSNISSLFTFNSLTKVVGLSDKTVKDYVGFFNDAFLLYTLERYDFSLKKQLRASKKIYCIDNGLTASAAFSFSANIGRYLENMVFCSFLQAEQKVYYYKTKNGLEVDFFRPDAIGSEKLLQVCADMQNEKTRQRECRALFKAFEELDLEGGIIVTMDEEDKIEKNGKIIRIVPAWKYFLYGVK